MFPKEFEERMKELLKNEYENFAKYRSQAMIEKLIPALDSFQMAFSLPATTKETENYRIGFEFILHQIKGALEQEGVIEIAPVVGEKFNHNLHSAVESIETEEDKLVDTIQKVRLNGYKLKDRLIRPATVVVYVLKVVKEEVKEETEDVKDEVIEETKVEEVIEEKPIEEIDPHNDHRIFMALSILLTKTGGKIKGAECVKKSFPDYLEVLEKLGA